MFAYIHIVCRIFQVTSVRHSPDGRWIVSGDSHGIVKVWDLTAGKLVQEFKSQTKQVITGLAFHPHEFLLAAASDHKVNVIRNVDRMDICAIFGPYACACVFACVHTIPIYASVACTHHLTRLIFGIWKHSVLFHLHIKKHKLFVVFDIVVMVNHFYLVLQMLFVYGDGNQ